MNPFLQSMFQAGYLSPWLHNLSEQETMRRHVAENKMRANELGGFLVNPALAPSDFGRARYGSVPGMSTSIGEKTPAMLRYLASNRLSHV